MRLQHNVGRLSVVVLTYYLADLTKLALEGAKAAGIAINATLVTALLLPELAFGVRRAVRRVKLHDP